MVARSSLTQVSPNYRRRYLTARSSDRRLTSSNHRYNSLLRKIACYMDKDAGKPSNMAGGWFVGPFSSIVFFAFYFGFFDMDFGLKGNILGFMGIRPESPWV